jgi:hypothetical protein
MMLNMRHAGGCTQNERIHLMEDGSVTLDFKRPWKDGTRSIVLEPKALLSRLSSIVPPPPVGMSRSIAAFCRV